MTPNTWLECNIQDVALWGAKISFWVFNPNKNSKVDTIFKILLSVKTYSTKDNFRSLYFGVFTFPAPHKLYSHEELNTWNDIYLV